MVGRPARWAGVVALLVVVALLAVATSSGVEGPERSDRPGRPGGAPVPTGPVPDPCGAPLPARAVGIAPGSDWKTDRRAVGDVGEMARIGVRWLRVGFEWAAIEGQQGRYRWDAVDAVVREAQSQCIAVLAMVGTTPRWARERGCQHLWCPPADPQQFARFVTAVADRYGGPGAPIRAWEVWNEANHVNWWWPEVDAEAYGRLAGVAARAIRARDPEVTVLLGGLAPSPPGNPDRRLPDEFLDEVYGTGAMDDLDGVAYHPYSYPSLPSERTGRNGFIDQVAAVREVMVDHGDEAKPIWLTEFGFSTTGGGPRQLDRQVEMLVDGFATWRSLPYAGPLFWFSWRDGDPGTGAAQRNFGLRAADDRPKPAYDAFRQELRR